MFFYFVNITWCILYLYLDIICLTLSEAIRHGNDQFASELARQLALKKAAVMFRIDDHEFSTDVKK